MAQKRMFDKCITNSDNFIEMPDSSQNLYFHLSMNADDDGFVDNWKSVMRMTGHKEDDLKVLISKQFIIPFESGVLVIKHWRINNYLRNDRYKPTIHQNEFKELTCEENGEYSQKNSLGIPTGNQLATQYSIVENSIEYIYTSKNDNAKQMLSNDFEEEFETLWKKYPNKQGRKDALRHFVNARKKGVSLEKINEGIDSYVEYIKRNGTAKQFIMHGSTWFNGEHWNDEYETNIEANDDIYTRIEDLQQLL